MASFSSRCMVLIVFAAAISASYADHHMNGTKEESVAGNFECFVCNSHEGADGEACYDPVPDVSKLRTAPCKYGHCYKYIQNVEAGKEEFRIISRGCTEDAEPGLLKKDLKEGCIFSTGTRGIQLEICTCDGSKCNKSDHVKPLMSFVGFAAIIAVLAQLTH